MTSGGSWQVVVHNDDVNSFVLVHHILRTVCGHDDARAREKTMEVHRSGRSVVGAYDRASAEAMALRLVRFGVRATVDGAR
ncbi:ATP-dependent Clp protease adaptor ClpS [Lentzea sp. NPDC102401]|uniref:ATP-dependent Clp protease adaptor ClpS n=1 Tax=Lentzea sp. NPDC102401 TaxID=3364128 RepID=UPI0037F5C2B0